MKKSEGYQYELIDVNRGRYRQILANYAETVQQQFAKAYREKDAVAFNQYSKEILNFIEDMDQLLTTPEDFLWGKWISEARSWGTTPLEANIFEKNARNLITFWGDECNILQPINGLEC